MDRLRVSTEHWPPRYVNRPGQGPPRRFSAVTWFKSLVGFGQLFTGEVPGDFWIEDVEKDETRVGIISCPCGATSRVPENGIRTCDGEDCGRVFMLLGDRIRVAKFDPTELQGAGADGEAGQPNS